MIGDGEQLAQKQNTGSHSGHGTQCFIIQPANKSIIIVRKAASEHWQKVYSYKDFSLEHSQLQSVAAGTTGIFQSWTLTATVHNCWDDWASAATGIWTIYTNQSYRGLYFNTSALYFNTLTATVTCSIYTIHSYSGPVLQHIDSYRDF